MQKILQKILVFLAIVAYGHGWTEEAILDLSACQRIALDTNPLARAASEGVCIAAETAAVAKASYYPDIAFHSHYFRWQRHDFFTINNPNGILPQNLIPPIIGPTNDYEFSVQSRWTLYDWGDRRSRLLAALAEKNAACNEAERIRQQILLGVATAFFNLNANRELKEVAIKNFERAQKHHQFAKDRYATGAAPLLDTYRTEVEVAEGKQELVKVESLLRISKVNLNSAMGLPPEIAIEIENVTQKPIFPQTIDLKAAENQALLHRPEILSLKNHLNSLKFRIQQAQSQNGPKLTAQAGYGKRDSNWPPKDDEWRFGVAMDLPIFTGYAITHNIRRTKAEFRQMVAEYDRLVLDVKQEIWTAYSRLLEAYEMIETSKAQVQNAKESMRLTEERYNAGAGIISDLLDTQTALTRAEAAHIDALWKYRSAYTSFMWSQGLL